MDERQQSEVKCSICNKPVTLHSDTGTDEDGKAVHKQCYATRITEENHPATPTSD
ncbi:MAG TPA: hypothetical protein VIH89_14840 [Candidatus Sulfotelmatobacter sp.]